MNLLRIIICIKFSTQKNPAKASFRNHLPPGTVSYRSNAFQHSHRLWLYTGIASLIKLKNALFCVLLFSLIVNLKTVPVKIRKLAPQKKLPGTNGSSEYWFDLRVCKDSIDSNEGFWNFPIFIVKIQVIALCLAKEQQPSLVWGVMKS